MTTSKDDGIEITWEDDGSMTIQWDEKDPVWSGLNNMSTEYVQQMLIDSLKARFAEETGDTLL